MAVVTSFENALLLRKYSATYNPGQSFWDTFTNFYLEFILLHPLGTYGREINLNRAFPSSKNSHFQSEA